MWSLLVELRRLFCESSKRFLWGVSIGGAVFSFFNLRSRSRDFSKFSTLGRRRGLSSLERCSELSFLDYSRSMGTGSISKGRGTHLGNLLGEYILPIGLLRDYFPFIFS